MHPIRASIAPLVFGNLASHGPSSTARSARSALREGAASAAGIIAMHSRPDPSAPSGSRSLPPPEEERDRVDTSFARYAGLGVQFAATILVLGLLGLWADKRFGTAPWLMILGIFLGAAGGFVSLVRQVPPARRPRSKTPPPR